MYKQQEWGQQTGLGESVRRLDLWDKEVCPERPGLPDCAYYMRNGSCGYGAKCRFNHPCDRGSSLAGGEYPERLGEPACEYYLRTGTCKFGGSCKFSHPKNAGGSLTNAPLNVNGYPLRPGEKECSYYLKTGQCKFNLTCKFDHPQPAGASVPAFARPFYPTVHPRSSPSHDQYHGNMRPPLLPGSYVSGAYGPMLLHPGMVPVTNWNPYSGPVSPSPGAPSVYGPPQQGSSAPGSTGAYPQLPSSTGLPSSLPKQQKFPERHGELNCKYYMRNGDCKYGSSCRYNHPPDWIVSTSNCALSSMGLPLRPGVQACSFYMQNGRCKFGHTCKFDHPLETIKYSKASYYAEIPG